MLQIIDLNAKIFEVSLGMFYLHEEHIVHGDIKGVSVLYCYILCLIYATIGECAGR